MLDSHPFETVEPTDHNGISKTTYFVGTAAMFAWFLEESLGTSVKRLGPIDRAKVLALSESDEVQKVIPPPPK